MLKKTSDDAIPAETVRIVRKAFPKGNLYIRLRDELGSIFQDEQFSELYSSTGQPGWPAWRLALVTIMQFMENLTDRQTAEAIRARLDWKYALGLKLDDPGIDHSVLNEFRERLLEGGKEWILLQRLLDVARERKLLGTKTQRTDSSYILARIRQMNRLEVVGEAM
jgi:transposase